MCTDYGRLPSEVPCKDGAVSDFIIINHISTLFLHVFAYSALCFFINVTDIDVTKGLVCPCSTLSVV